MRKKKNSATIGSVTLENSHDFTIIPSQCLYKMLTRTFGPIVIDMLA